jgi:hypothetical protein
MKKWETLRLNNDAKMSRFLTVVENSSLSHERFFVRRAP